MKFTTILVATMAALSNALAIDQSSAETHVERSLIKRAITCVPKDGKYGHEAELTQCVNDMRNNPRWGEWTCGGRKFYMGGTAWNSPADCIGGCTPCLLGGAQIGLAVNGCDQQTGAAHCWNGWDNL